MTEFIQTHGCRRQVLDWQMDGQGAEGSCIQTHSVYWDQCRATRKSVRARAIAEDEFQVHGEGEEEAVKGAQVVKHLLSEVQAA
jgi:hypothetical protein